MWRTRLAQAVTIHRSRAATASIRPSSDLTDDLFKANADNLKQGNAALIATIVESQQIADEGRRKRADAAVQLETLEVEPRRTLISASAPIKKAAAPPALASQPVL